MQLSRLTTLSAAALLAPLAASAQSDWRYRATVYGWTAGLDLAAGTSRGTVEGDLSIGDLLENLNFAFMATAEARYGPWGIIGDFVYADIELDNAVPPNSGGYTGAVVDSDLTVGSIYGTYRVHETSQLSVDLGVGLRWMDVSVSTTLTPGPVNAVNADDWTDVVAAIRLRSDFNDRWYGVAFADVGGGLDGDSSSWQVMAAVGYKFSPMWSAELGYRYLSISNTINGNDLDLDMSGPLIGVTARF